MMKLQCTLTHTHAHGVLKLLGAGNMLAKACLTPEARAGMMYCFRILPRSSVSSSTSGLSSHPIIILGHFQVFCMFALTPASSLLLYT